MTFLGLWAHYLSVAGMVVLALFVLFALWALLGYGLSRLLGDDEMVGHFVASIFLLTLLITGVMAYVKSQDVTPPKPVPYEQPK